jgi:hypothetical protein
MLHSITINTTNTTKLWNRLGISLILPLLLIVLYTPSSFAEISNSKVTSRSDVFSLQDCGVFDSCIDPIIRIFPLMQFRWSSGQAENDIQSIQDSPKDPFSGTSLFELPFP